MTQLKRLALLLLILALLTGGVYAWLFAGLPDPSDLEQRLMPPSVRITDQDGRLLYEVLPEDTGRHTRLKLAEIPLALQQATIATEDHNFYNNPGVDLTGILRSMWINLQGGETLAGGSTITQQVARNLLLDPQERTERSLRRKLRESLLAWQMARRFSKEQILEFYLNEMNYGGMAYGVEAAAHTYFGKPARQLDLAQCTLLAGLPQAPAAYNPLTHPEAARQRQKIVLELMEKHGYLTAAERQLAEREPLIYSTSPYPAEALHFVMLVRSELDEWITPAEIYQYGGLEVRTTLNLNWQHLAEKAVNQQMQRLRNNPDGINYNVNSAALVALEPHSGAIRAMVGSPDYFNQATGGAINMATTLRQPGSALKPLIYASLLDPRRAEPWTAATSILDVNTSFVTHDGYSYTPANYDELEHGPVSVRTAIGSSLNIPAVIALKTLGLPDFVSAANDFGIASLNAKSEYDLSVALGGGEITLLELARAYAVFANGGYRIQPYTIQELRDPQGRVIKQHETVPAPRVLDERVAWLISDILNDDEARRLGFGRNSTLKLDRPAAVKTGTTTNYHDNWTVGYTPEIVAGVWAGNTDFHPMRDVTGLTGAAPIWHQFLRDVLKGRPEQDFTRPPGLVQVEVCTLSGLLPGDACAYRRTEWFIEGTQPTQTDTLYRQVTLDRRSGGLAGPDTPADQLQTAVALDLPPQAQAWGRSQGLLLLADLLAAAPAGVNAPADLPGDLVLLSPPPNARYRIANGYPLAYQRLLIQAAGEGLQSVTLWLDGALLARLDAPPYEVWWQLNPGKHRAWVEATTPSGRTLSSPVSEFEVLPAVTH